MDNSKIKKEAELLEQFRDPNGEIKIILKDKKGNELHLDTKEGTASLNCQDGHREDISPIDAAAVIIVVISSASKAADTGLPPVDSVSLQHPSDGSTRQNLPKKNDAPLLSLGQLSPMQKVCTELSRQPTQSR